MTNLYFFHLHACYSIFQNFFCAGIQFFIVLNSYKKSINNYPNKKKFILTHLLIWAAKLFFFGKWKGQKMDNNTKVYTLSEMREMMIDTSDYQFMEEVGEFTGTLELKAEGHKKSIRIFLTLTDGRKIITPIFWWQSYLGFYYMPIGTKLRLFYSESSLNKIYLEKIEVIGDA